MNMITNCGCFNRNLYLIKLLLSGLLLLLLLTDQAQSRNMPDVFIKVEPSSGTVYRGEAFFLRVKLYHAVSIIDPENELKLEIKDALTFELEKKEKNRSVELVKGVPYQVLQLKNLVVVPQSPGDCVIPAVTASIKRSVVKADDFFGGETIVSESLSFPQSLVRVKALPAISSALPFSGAVGDFSMSGKFKEDPGQGGDLSLAVKIEGQGVLQFFNILPPKLPAGVALIDTKIEESQNATDKGLQSAKFITFTFFSAYKGNFVIPALKALVFNPESRSFEVLEVPEFKWKVLKGKDAPVDTAGRVEAMLLKPGSELEGTSINLSPFVKGLILVTGAALYFLAFYLKKRKALKAAYPKQYAFRNAGRVAKRKLKKLERAEAVLEYGLFLQQLEKIMVAYLSSKLMVQSGQFGTQDLLKLTHRYGITEEQASSLHALFESIYRSRFSPGKTGPGSLSIANSFFIVDSLERIFNETDLNSVPSDPVG